MSNQNQIIQAPFFFYLLSSNFKNWSYKEVKEDDSLIILNELELTKTGICCRSLLDDVLDAAVAFITAAPYHDGKLHPDIYWKNYEQAKEEFIKTEKINGYEILNLQTMEKLWISHYDMDFLQNVNN